MPQSLVRPRLHNTQTRDESFAGVTYHLEGELVPALTVEIGPSSGLYFEHHVMFWKHTQVNIGLKPLKGMLKRMIAGMQILVTEAQGMGSIAFSLDGPGHIVPLHLEPGDEIHVREHQFLAATGSVDYTFERVKGLRNLLVGGNNFFIDHFSVKDKPGILWLHGYGNVFELVLGPGEQIDVEPGAWLYKDASVKMESKFQSLATGLFGSMGMNFALNRFTGPGRLGLQSMTLNFETSD